MKSLKLIFINLRQGFITFPFMFFIFMLGSIISSVSFIYLYGNVMPYMKVNYETYISYRTCSAILNSDANVNSEYISYVKEYVKDWVIDDIIFITEQLGTFEYEDKMLSIPICASINNRVDTHTYKVSGKQIFDKNEIEQKKSVVIIPDLFLKERLKYINFDNKQYDVIGVYSGGSGYSNAYIPLTVLLEMKTNITQINFVLNDFLNEKDFNKFINYIGELKNVTNVTMFNVNNKNISLDYSGTEILLLCIMFLTSILSFIYFMKYFDDKNKYVNVVYMLSGSSKEHIAIILLLQKIITISCVSLISILIHIFLRNSLFKKVNFLDNINYKPLDYLIIFLMMVLITFISLLPQLILFIKKPINTIRTTC